ncbi:hypothetical protein GFL63_08700 [Rhizobium leguminosarum bv. viciae]|nr:hypothetical protein [Rhizobium leguminosarum bv. viciae]
MRRWRSLRSNVQDLPLTLTLSPHAGRRDVPRETLARNGEVATDPFAPQAGLRRTGRDTWLDPGWCRQADEGQTRA